MKSFQKKALKFLISPFALGIVVTMAMVYISAVYYNGRASIAKNDHSIVGMISQFHQKTIDWRLTDRGQAQGSDRVAILAVDDKSIEQEGRWPWPRDKQAKLVERAVNLGAKSVSFDVVYSEEDQNSSISSLRRLRRGLASKAKLDDDTKAMIESEIVATDGDRAFAETIRRQADHLVLGAYWDPAEQSTEPLRGFCFDALFSRTSEARYWQKEAISPMINDATAERVHFPEEFKSNLTDYFTILEVKNSQDWFDQHKDLNARIAESLEDLAQVIPADAYPGVATLWLNNDTATAKTLLEQVSPALANPEGVRLLFSRFGAAFTKKEAASLMGDVREAGADYCNKSFFTDHDQLLSTDAYKKVWGDTPDAREQFKQFSWATVWSKMATNRKPAANGDAVPATVEDEIERLRAQVAPNRITSVSRWWVNIPLLAEPTHHTGYFNAQLDTDGSIRRSPLIVRLANSYVASLAMRTFLLDQGYRLSADIDNEPESGGKKMAKVLKDLKVLDAQNQIVMHVPVDDEGQLLINYSGRQLMFPYISAADILNDSPEMTVDVQKKDGLGWHQAPVKVKKAEFLKDKLLILGATSTGIYDLRVTPFDENYPGVETHANVLSNLLVENARAKGERMPASAPGFLRTHPAEPRVMWGLLLGIGLMLSALLSYFGSVAGLGITGAFMGTIYALDKFWLFKSGIVTTVLFPQFEIFGTFVTLTFYKYFTEERKKRELKGTFEKYVSPAIVAEVLSDPENIELGGKKVEMTVMFSDVRGFTTISEKLDPRQLSDLLNSYLTPMTDLVFKHKGTLDKYMGDAIMSFWGAPIHFPDHAKHACRCALAMLVKLKELQAEYRAKGLPEIDIGIGLNTGEMSVGNMGSETVRSYTVMGDSVNLGSRLEGINKQYGTRIIISEFTQKEVADSFVTREVDWVRVKGKAQPVRIFELIAEGKVAPEKEQVLKFFAEGFDLYHARKFQEAIEKFSEALKIMPEDSCSQLYLERCQDYLTEAPPEDWDGVYNMKSK